MNDRDSNEPQLQAMSLLATLRTAAEVCHALGLRRTGKDPSEQEDAASARANLLEAREELHDVATRLRLGQIIERDESSALVHAFEDRMMLARAARDLHLVHQRLLSLFPAVDAEVVERARVVQAEAARLAAAEDDGFGEALLLWVDAMVLLSHQIVEATDRAD